MRKNGYKVIIRNFKPYTKSHMKSVPVIKRKAALRNVHTHTPVVPTPAVEKPAEPVITIEIKSCCVCAENFDVKIRGSVRETRSDRKFKYAFCSTECEVLFDDGLL